MAYAMVNTYGFSPKIGQVNFSNMGDGFNKPYSDSTGKEIDEEVKRIVDEQWDRTVHRQFVSLLRRSLFRWSRYMVY